MQRIAVIGTLALVPVALAQTAITIDIDQPTLLPGESTVVTMRAGYGALDYAIARVETDLSTSVGALGWSDALIVPPMDGPATTAGSATASGFEGITAFQLNFPGGAGIFADPSNPIAFWQATYTAPLDAGTPFIVDLATTTGVYEVYTDRDSGLSESRLADLTEGAATIRVIPAPASALVLALGACAVRRRR